ncbi:8717_t:CDS:2, partial [Paraglomus occultum]
RHEFSKNDQERGKSSLSLVAAVHWKLTKVCENRQDCGAVEYPLRDHRFFPIVSPSFSTSINHRHVFSHRHLPNHFFVSMMIAMPGNFENVPTRNTYETRIPASPWDKRLANTSSTPSKRTTKGYIPNTPLEVILSVPVN